MSKQHSMADALSIQKDFEAQYARAKGVVGVGIGLNDRRDDLALSVSVTQPGEAAELPRSFRGLDVVVDVVHKYQAY